MPKLAINMQITEGGYGGSNTFANLLYEELSEQGWYMTTKLEKGLDIILIVNNRMAGSATFGLQEVKLYKKLFPVTRVIQRVNSCDEQRGKSLGNDAAIRRFSEIADAQIFVSEFIQRYWLDNGITLKKQRRIIRAGADPRIFYPRLTNRLHSKAQLNLVTHHWSDNKMKGFDTYKRFDNLLSDDFWSEKFTFTFIGNLRERETFRNTFFMRPMPAKEVGNLLRQYDGYLTGSKMEPGGNHPVEALQSGLPVLFLESGSMAEYCNDYGIGFTDSSFEDKLLLFYDRFERLKNLVAERKHTGKDMCDSYLDLFEYTLVKKPKIQEQMVRGRMVIFWLLSGGVRCARLFERLCLKLFKFNVRR